MRRAVFLLAIVLVLGLLAPFVRAQGDVGIAPPQATLEVGEQKQFRAYQQVGGAPLDVTDQGEWTASPSSVARMVGQGKVQAVSPGQATVTFRTSSGEMAYADVTVVQGKGDKPTQWRDGPIGLMVGGTLCGIAEIIYGFPGFQTPDTLVFGVGGPKVAGVFTEREWDALARWYRLFAGVALSGYVVYLILLVHGLRAVVGSQNPVQRASVTEAVTDTLVAMCIAVFGLAVLRAMLEVNQALVNAISTWMGTEGMSWVGSFRKEMLDELVVPHSLLWTGVVRVVYAFTAISLNFLYLVRKFVLAVSVVLLPVVGWAWAFKGTRLPVLLLGTEMVTNSLMSFSHALVLALMWDLFYRRGPSAAAGGIPGQLLGVLSRGVSILVGVSGLVALVMVAACGYRIMAATTAQERAAAYEKLRSTLTAVAFLFGTWVFMQVLLEVVVR